MVQKVMGWHKGFAGFRYSLCSGARVLQKMDVILQWADSSAYGLNLGKDRVVTPSPYMTWYGLRQRAQDSGPDRHRLLAILTCSGHF